MNKPLDLYDEYLRRGENIYLLMLKLSNNNLQIINLPNNNWQDKNIQMRILQDNHSQILNL